MNPSSLLLSLTLVLAPLGSVPRSAQALSQDMATGGPLAGYGTSVAVGSEAVGSRAVGSRAVGSRAVGSRAVDSQAVFVGEAGNIMRPGAVYVYHKVLGEWS